MNEKFGFFFFSISGPYAWVQYVPGEPIPRSRPNEGSVQGRNRIKRIKLRKAFIKVPASSSSIPFFLKIFQSFWLLFASMMRGVACIIFIGFVPL